MKQKNNQQGFTLLELLIVIAIMGVLSVVLIFLLNPAETLKKSRDVQRISDLSTLKTALGLYLTSVNTPYLAGAASNAGCKTGAGAGAYGAGVKIYYSYPSDSPGAAITDTTLDGGTTNPAANQVLNAALSNIDGTGWLPVNLGALSGGSPLSNMPIDPINTVTTVGVVASTDLVYRYVCNTTSTTFEIDSQLESTAYTSDDNRRVKDGGNNANFFEMGTNLLLLGAGTDF